MLGEQCSEISAFVTFGNEWRFGDLDFSLRLNSFLLPIKCILYDRQEFLCQIEDRHSL